MIPRRATQKLLELASAFKAVAMTGPRQSGKTTLARAAFPKKPYVSLENPDNRLFAEQDPRGFLNTYANGAIFDEVQRVPHLFSYLQEILDNSSQKGMYILTGSNNFLLQQSISQTLAGRIAHLFLLPFSIRELHDANLLPATDNELMLKGFYPPIYDQGLPVSDWCRNYIRTYVERDVRQIKNINDLQTFERFIALLAGRCGQELNMTALGVEVGVDSKTVQAWLSILESSFVVYLLKPHHKNFNKTITKRPKVYFYDTALVCSLLRIRTVELLINHPLRGAIFENMVITELIKLRMNVGEDVNLFYWRDKTGREVDIIVEEGLHLLPIEIKSGQTIQNDYFKNIDYWNQLSGEEKAVVLYGGDQRQYRSNGTQVINWREFIKE